MGDWNADSKSHVASMSTGDFYSSEKSAVMDKVDSVKIELVTSSGETQLLKDKVELLKGEVIDAAVMSCAALCDFYEQQIDQAKQQGVLLSLHLKATMMKVSDPIMFGHAVNVFYKDVFEKYSCRHLKSWA